MATPYDGQFTPIATQLFRLLNIKDISYDQRRMVPFKAGGGTNKKRASIFQKGQNIDLLPYMGPRKAIY